MHAVKRVVIVSRHFWPLISDATLRLYHWVESLQSNGVQVTVLTTRPVKSWPKQIRLGDTHVIRFDGNTLLTFRSSKHSVAMQSWLDANSENVDAIYFDECGIEAHTFLTSSANPSRPAVLVRFDQAARADRESTGMLRSSISDAPSRQAMDVCRRADAVWVTNAIANQALLTAGLNSSPVLRSSDGGTRIDRSIGAQRSARQVLASVNHDLMSKSTDRVILCPGDLTEDWQSEQLVRAAGPLVERHRELRLWLHGDGSLCKRIGELLKFEGWKHSIIMPGVFSDVVPLLQVADLCLFPSVSSGLSWMIPTCFASGIPLLMAECNQTKSVAGDQADAVLFNRSDPNDLRERLESWLHDGSALQRSSMAFAARSLQSTHAQPDVLKMLSEVVAKCAGTS